MTHFILIHNPTPHLLIPALMEPLIFHDLIDGQMCETQIARNFLCVRRLAHARRACDEDVGVRARHDYFVRELGWIGGLRLDSKLRRHNSDIGVVEVRSRVEGIWGHLNVD
jgi:hypothetical protein